LLFVSPQEITSLANLPRIQDLYIEKEGEGEREEEEGSVENMK
jgi:hypothetical protein